MQLGIVLPRGAVGDYCGWESERVWASMVSLAREAEEFGLESIWLTDHVHTLSPPFDEPTFESFTSLTALAALTKRVRIGHIVICAGFRNPALTAKMISTMDVISGGRIEFGIGAGGRREEWTAYGYRFPGTAERLGALADHLAIVTRMLVPGREAHATYQGTFASVSDAVNVPKPTQVHVPITVGGNGPNVTWRLAAQYADELNLDDMAPQDVVQALPIIQSRCEERGRDPGTLRVSVGLWWASQMERSERRDLLASYRDLGLARVMVLAHPDEEFVPLLAEDARSAGVLV